MNSISAVGVRPGDQDVVGYEMNIVHPDLVPAPDLDRQAMLDIQAQVRDIACLRDDRVAADLEADTIVGGVDQAFRSDEVVSAVVCLQGGTVVDDAVATVPIDLPYLPGLLAFREAGGILAAVTSLSTGIDVLLCDGNGRLHPRGAGLATHVGVVLDIPTVGIAKSLLCGTFDGPEPPYPPGTSVPIRADDGVELPFGSLLGYAIQTKQWDSPDRHINPLYVSPGHRVSPETAVSIVQATVDGYKLPEPIRLADRLAEVAATDRSSR